MDKTAAEVVYFVRIGKYIKIGFTSNLKQRLKSFLTSSPDVTLLFSVEGNRSLEAKIHRLLTELKVARELFHHDGRIDRFQHCVESGGLELGLKFLEEISPGQRRRAKEDAQNRRTVQRRQSKAEKDAYFASLVTQRKRQVGW